MSNNERDKKFWVILPTEATESYLKARRVHTAFDLTDELKRIRKTRLITNGISLEEIRAIDERICKEYDKRFGFGYGVNDMPERPYVREASHLRLVPHPKPTQSDPDPC